MYPLFLRGYVSLLVIPSLLLRVLFVLFFSLLYGLHELNEKQAVFA